jgi:hypothetical protein
VDLRTSGPSVWWIFGLVGGHQSEEAIKWGGPSDKTEKPTPRLTAGVAR